MIYPTRPPFPGLPRKNKIHLSFRKRGFKSRNARFLAWGLLLAVSSGLLSLCARLIPGFAQGYATWVYPVFVGLWGRLCGVFPFSLSEAGLYVLGLFFLYFIIRNIKRPLRLFSRVFFLCSALLFVFNVNCGVNYYRYPFSYEAGFDMEKSSADQLYRLCLYLTEEVNKAVLETDGSQPPWPDAPAGQTQDTPNPSVALLREMGQEGQKAMKSLGNVYPQLHGSYPYPKPLINPRLLSVQQLCGIYSPFTIEANYNREMPYYNIPHTICHELSHLKGFMREDEANFIGYLACVGSESPYFRYSGYLAGWVYAGNALAKVDPQAYAQLYGQLAPQAVTDLAWNNQFWDRFDGRVAEASNQLNDRYLKAHSQEDGVRSYGRMVDLMLAYYRGKL